MLSISTNQIPNSPFLSPQTPNPPISQSSSSTVPQSGFMYYIRRFENPNFVRSGAEIEAQMPPPSRDRLSRPVDISTLFPGAARKVDLKVDEPGLRWSGLSGTPSSGSVRRSVPAHRAVRTFSGGRENVTPGRVVRSSRGRGRVSPYWHRRTPLRDITAIVRAIERSRAILHQDDQEETNAQASSSSQLEHEEAIDSPTPIPTTSIEPNAQPTPEIKVRNTMANILNEKGQDSNHITPQKRLLDSIDEVRDVLVEEKRKKENTPAAQKAETRKKIRTLMSMR